MTQPIKFSDGATADVARQKQALKDYKSKEPESAATDVPNIPKDRMERIGRAAETFNKYHKLYSQDHGLPEEELVAAIALEMYNCREWYPKNLGGTPKFDIITDEIYRWFEANKNT